MKKFNADGGYRKDATKDTETNDLNKLKGQSLEESNDYLDDTLLLNDLPEELNKAIESKEEEMKL